MVHKNKVYVAFDGDNDMSYYNLLKAWNANENIDFTFYNVHSINTARDSSQETSIKNQLRIRLNTTKVLILLVGEHTRYLYKFVRWELETALRMNIPIIAVNLNGLRYMDKNRCPPIIQDEFVVHIAFNRKALKYAIDNWPEYYQSHKNSQNGAMYYKDGIYD